jgi:hypothetical protein
MARALHGAGCAVQIQQLVTIYSTNCKKDEQEACFLESEAKAAIVEIN